MIPLSDDNPTTLKPLVTITFIVACVFVFVWQFSLGPERGQQIIYALGVIPAVLLGQRELPPE
jgi:membrane associated rhomboid family serine protease